MGKMEILTPCKIETLKQIDTQFEMKFGMGDFVGDTIPHAQNENCVRKGGSYGSGGEMFNPSVFFSFFSFFVP